jgi:hypothetical protein
MIGYMVSYIEYQDNINITGGQSPFVNRREGDDVRPGMPASSLSIGWFKRIHGMRSFLAVKKK